MLLTARVATVCTVMLCLLSMTFFVFPAYAENAMDPIREEPAAREESIPAATQAQPQQKQAASAEQEQTFEIYAFKLEGNTLFTTQRLLDLVDDLVGPGRTAADVEKGRDILENFYHDEGYPTVLVNIPEQKVEGGIIQLQVIESRVKVAKVNGNRYYSTDHILDKLPSVSPGSVLYVPDVQSQINKLNRNPDLKVVPAMSAGKELGTVDMELKVEDKLPFHGSLEVNNRSTHDTTPLRINGSAHYDNLWGLDHSLSGQYQFSPQNFNEVEVVSTSYTLPAPWNRDDSLVVYGTYSNSNTTFGEGFSTLGKGDVIGVRYIAPLTPYKSYNHSAVLGFDYKHFDENVGTTGGVISTPVEYMPFSIAYSGSIPDSGGVTLLNATFNIAFRGLVAREQQFEDKRYKARTNYIFANLGVERRQQLPGGASLGVKLDGQVADQPLISNEQYSAGGMDSVRGYYDSEMMGDNAFHGMIELVSPDLAPKVGLGGRFRITPYGFYDFAALWVKDPLPNQDKVMDLQGTGVGIRGVLFQDVEYQCDWAYALVASNKLKSGTQRVYFKVKYQF